LTSEVRTVLQRTPAGKRKKAVPTCGGGAGNMLYRLGVKRLFREFKHETAVVQHQQEPDEEEKPHKKIKHAVAFAARILNVIHQLTKL
jgi:hypothetical protein